MDAGEDITRILQQAREGDAVALDRVFAIVYDELHRIARAQRRRVRPGETLGTTAVVHEAYLKLVRSAAASYADRAHFFAVAARAMRQILLNRARDQVAQKRGGGAERVTLGDADAAVPARAEEFLALDAALERLAALDARLAQVVELRYFAGLDVKEAADALGIGEATVKRDWATARAFLRRELQADA